MIGFRQEGWHAVTQWVTLTANTSYYFEAWVKPLNTASGQMYQNAKLQVMLQSEECKYIAFLSTLTHGFG